MIKLTGINKIYPVGKDSFYALRNVDLEIASGEFVAICGASGSGKSTLLNIIGCIDESTDGTYLLDGTNVDLLNDEKKAAIRNSKIGFVLQDFALLNDQTVLYNTMLPLLLSKRPFRSVRKMALDALKRVGLEDQAKKKASNLSGGQRQRVAIARAIANEPSLILADEPTGQLDSKTGMQIMQQLRELNNQGITVIVVTHNDAVAKMASRIIRLEDGHVV